MLNRRVAEKKLFDTPVKNEPVKSNVASSTIKKASASKVSYHTVSKGDTVSEIAVQNGISIAQIKKLNKLDDKCVIRVGQELRVK